MLSWVIQQVAISLVVIILIHSIYNFLQLNLTTPKVRDLVNKPSKQYEEMYKTFKETENKTSDIENDNNNNNDNVMKFELQNYLKELSTENRSQNNNDKKDIANEPTIDKIQSGTFSDNFTPAYETF